MVRRTLAFAVLLAWCEALLLFRMNYSGRTTFVFLTWNLFLASVPFAAAAVLDRLQRRNQWPLFQWCAFAVWLLFLPNAPYIITDLMHLRSRPPIPLWYDVLLLMSSAGTGLLLGYASVLMVQRGIERRFGRKAGWLVATTALLLSAYGIYLGRFLRFNSWEAITDPLPLFADIVDHLTNPLHHPRTLAVTVLFGIALTLGYITLRVMTHDDGQRLES